MMSATKEPGKILFVLGNFELGGAENQALQTARFFKERKNFEVQVLAFGKPRVVSNLCEQYGLPWKSVNFPWLQIFLIKHLFSKKLNLKKFETVVRSLSPTIIISYTTFPNVFCGLIWKETGARLCIWNQRDVLDDIINPSIERDAIRNVPVVLTNSFHGKKFLERKFSLNPDKITVFRNSIQLNPPKWANNVWRKHLGIKESTILVSMVANLTCRKDHVTLLHAWRILVDLYEKEEKPEIMLVLAGRWDETYSSLKNMVKDLHIQESVTFLGPVDDIAGLLNTTGIGILSSVSEGSPNSLLEYMASGLPVVASDIPGVREVIPDSQVPFLFSYGDSSSLAQILKKLIADPDLRKKIGDSNKQYALEHFNPEKNNEFLFDIMVNNS